MKVEIREQRPGEPWPSGQMWEVPTVTNLRSICADLTPDEAAEIVAPHGAKRLAHVMAARIAEVVKKRGDDVLLVKRSVVKLRDIKAGDKIGPLGDPALKDATVHDRDVASLRWIAPVLSEADANAVLAQLAGQPRTVEGTLAAIKAYLQTTGPVEFVMVDDPGEPVPS